MILTSILKPLPQVGPEHLYNGKTSQQMFETLSSCSLSTDTYLTHVNNRDTRKRGEMFVVSSKQTRTTSGLFIVNLEHVSNLLLVFA